MVGAQNQGMGFQNQLYEKPEAFMDNIMQQNQKGSSETKLILLVGKQIIIAPNELTATNMSDFKSLMDKYNLLSKREKSIISLAGGYPSYIFDYTNYQDHFDLSLTDVVVGIKVAEVDYTIHFQQSSFSIETLNLFLEEGRVAIDPSIWKEIDNKPYITRANLDSLPYNVYVVSTDRTSFVNVVFGIRKISDKGQDEVVGISCKTPGRDRHILPIDLDEEQQKQLLALTGVMDGYPTYHLLPEIVK
jgi:hypothetical protein